MKKNLILALSSLMILTTIGYGQAGVNYTNFLRQVQLPTNVVWDIAVVPQGKDLLSALAINPGGARFELWTIRGTPLTVYLLDTRYVGTYVPQAEVRILSEDPYGLVPRTRADRPFTVEITTQGLRTGVNDPVASKSMHLLRHVQAYPAGGTDLNINRNQATLLSQVTLTNNAVHRLAYAINSVPNANRTKARGEERFSVFSLADYQAPASQIASRYIQIWPTAEGTLTGISNGQIVRFDIPAVTFTVVDIYPDSKIYAQVYQGSPVLGTEGITIPSSRHNYEQAVPPANLAITMNDIESLIDDDGIWTIELIEVTPFGSTRLAHRWFTVDRTIQVNGSVNTIE